MVRNLEATGVGLPPDHAVVLDAPDPRAAAALAGAARGDHRPARTLLARTRAEADWYLRGEAVQALADLSAHDATWLDSWRAEAPDDPDALVVTAFLRVAQAWEVRTGRRAEQVEADRFKAFSALLDDALPVVEAALAANPGDPVPWSAALAHCTGAEAPRDVFDAYLGAALACDPHHLPTHLHAVQYLAPKWHGSVEEMLGHAARAAADAPADSPVRALEVVAMTEAGLEADTGRGRGAAPSDERVAAAVATAAEWSATRAPEDPRARVVRNHLVWAINGQERWAESLDVYRSLGRYATSVPWQYAGDPLAAFLHFRDRARSRLAASVPRNGTVPAPAVPLPESASGHAPREIAYVPATPQKVYQELLLCGATVRLAPVRGWTLMEPAPSEETPGKRGRRATLLRLDGLTNIARSAFDPSGLPVLVAHLGAGGNSTLTLVKAGGTPAAHRWSGPGGVPSAETAREHAALFVAAADGGDSAEVARLLRDPGEPAALLVRTLHALSLPPLPAGFGERDEVLATFPGATVHRARSLWQGMKDFMSDDTDPNPPLGLGR
ncbi:hypothetical protein [Streptomyces sp. NPDC008150]|uniref:hypothetical protein n=1 Tax=Streptomyces sp. NPDC008150 TaxID=3364816 RepID=UPI0036E4AC9E